MVSYDLLTLTLGICWPELEWVSQLTLNYKLPTHLR